MKNLFITWLNQLHIRQKILLFIWVLTTILVFALQDVFVVQQAGLRDFVPSNMSNAITAAQPLSVVLAPIENHIQKLRVRFALPENTLEYPVTLTLMAADGENVQNPIFSHNFTTADLQSGQYIDVILPDCLQKGAQYTALFESCETDDTYAVRVNIGTASRTDIAQWYCDDALQPDVPEITLLYAHFGTTSFLLCFVLLLLALAAICLPSLSNVFFKRTYAACLLAGSPVLLLWSTELLNRGNMLGMPVKAIVANLILFYAIELVFFAVFANSGAAVCCTSFLVLLGAVVNYFVVDFRYTVVLPQDVFALGTAANVAGSYTYTWSVSLVYALLIFFTTVCFGTRDICLLRGWRQRIASGFLCVFFCCGTWFFVINSPQNFDVQLMIYEQTTAARNNGFYMNFAINIPLMFTQKPQNYSVNALKALQPEQTALPQPEVLPNILVIMDESFTDTSLLLDLNTSGDVLPYLHALATDENAFVGQVAVPVYGGGTSCTEYEALTGFSFLLDQASYAPYMKFFATETPTLASHMQALGYKTIAMHPGAAKNWYRNKAYPNMGFEDIYFLADLEQQELLRGFMTDACDFSYLTKYIQNNDDPVFVFNTTIQNHGGYEAGLQGCITISDLDTSWVPQANEYLSLLNISDASFHALLETLMQLDEPTVVLFFGDHWSFFSPEYLQVLGKDTNTMSQDELLQYHSTPYVLWSNYGLDFSSAPAQTSANYLGTILLQQTGLPMSGWQAFLAQGMEDYPVFSMYNVTAANSPTRTLEEYSLQYASLQYNALVDSANRVQSIFN